MTKLDELTKKYKDQLQKAQKERETLAGRLNQLESLIDQLKGALFALSEASQPEPEQDTESEKTGGPEKAAEPKPIENNPKKTDKE